MYLKVELPLVQQLRQSVFPQILEILNLHREARGLSSAQQDVLQPPLLKNSQVLLNQLLKQVPVALGTFL